MQLDIYDLMILWGGDFYEECLKEAEERARRGSYSEEKIRPEEVPLDWMLAVAIGKILDRSENE
jgi:hypothetical protein